MDNQQDGRKNHSSGNQNPAVHVCNRCGWPFPNPHPSAKHRRAHKKICGTIEGYKLFESGKNTVAGDDEQHVDDEIKTPTPKDANRGDSQKSLDGFDRAISSRSEDEVFADASEDFPASGLSPETDLLEEKENALLHVKRVVDGDSDGNCSPEVDSQMGNFELPESSANLQEGISGNQDLAASSNIDDAAVEEDASAPDFYPMETKSPRNYSEMSEGINAQEEGMDNGLEANLEGNREGNCDFDAPDVCLAESESRYEKREKISDTDVAAYLGTVQLQKESASMLGLTPSEIPQCTEIKYVDHKNISGDNAKLETDMDQEVSPSDSSKSLEDGLSKAAGNVPTNLLSTPDDIPVVGHTEVSVEGPEGPKGAKLHQDDYLESFEISEIKEPQPEGSTLLQYNTGVQSGEPSIDLGVSSCDTHAYEDKDNYRSATDRAVVKESPVAGESDVYEIKQTIIKGTNDPADPSGGQESEMERSLQVQSPPQESSDFSDPLHPNLSPDNSTSVISSSTHGIAKTDASANLINKSVGPDDRSSSGNDMIELQDIAVPENNKISKEKRCEEGNFVCPEPSGTHHGFQGHTMTSVVEEDGASHCHGEGKTETSEASDIYLIEGSLEKAQTFGTSLADEATVSRLESSVTASGTISEFHHNIESTDSDRVSGAPVVSKEDTIIVDEKAVREYAQAAGRASDSYQNLKESECTDPERVLGDPKVGKEKINADEKVERSAQAVSKAGESYQDLQNSEYADLDEVSGAREVSRKDVFSGNEKREREFAQDASTTNESCYEKAVELYQETCETHTEEELLFSPVAAKTPVETSEAVENACTNSQSMKAEKHRMSQVEVSVGSSGQKDGRDTSFAAFSVLSEQGGNAAAADAESEKSNVKKLQGESNGRQSEKAKLSGSACQMNVVEPGATEAGHEIDAQQVQATNNPSSQLMSSSSQARCLPSQAHVVNQLQERRKGEEITEKVTNWSGEKQHHVPLKNLLIEAKSPKQQDKHAAGESSSSATRVSSILCPESPPEKGEIDREWNSPARYPTNIRREERKAKARPFWVPFVCCSSGS